MEVNKTKTDWVFLSMGFISIIILCVLFYIVFFVIEQPVVVVDNSTIICIANKTQLFVSTGCGYCTKQKTIFSDNLNLFNITDCVNNSELCTINKITGVPTWVISGEHYVGVKNIKELKELTQC